MPSKVILLSGPICSGKTALAEKLSNNYQVDCFKTNILINDLSKELKSERRTYQNAGEYLDKKTKGKWVCDEVQRRLVDPNQDKLVVVDSIRTKQQIKAFRSAYGPRVIHVHLSASDAELKKDTQKKGRQAKLKSWTLTRI